MMSRLESRMDTSEVIMQHLAKFAKKALEEIQRLFDDSGANLRSVERETDTEPKGEEPELLYDGVKGQVNLLALGGSIDADKIWLLATNIWTLDELRTQCIDSKRTAKENSWTRIKRRFLKKRRDKFWGRGSRRNCIKKFSIW